MDTDFPGLLALLRRNTDPGWLQPLLDDPASSAIVGASISMFARMGLAAIHNRDAAMIGACSAGQVGTCSITVSRADGSSSGTIPAGYPFLDDRGIAAVTQTPVPVAVGVLTVVLPCQTLRKTEEVNTVDPANFQIDPLNGTQVLDVFGFVNLIASPVDPSTITSDPATSLPFPASGPTTFTAVASATAIEGGAVDFLSVHAKERGLQRQPNEREDDFRQRVRNIPDAVSPIAVADVVQSVAQQRGLPPFLTLEPFEDGADPALKDLHGLGAFGGLAIAVDFFDDFGIGAFVLDRRQTTAYFSVEAQDYVKDIDSAVLYWDAGYWDDDVMGYPDAELTFPVIAMASLLALQQSVQVKKAGGVNFDLLLFQGKTVSAVGQSMSASLSVAWVLTPPAGKVWLMLEGLVDHDQPTVGAAPPIPENAGIVAHNLNFVLVNGTGTITDLWFHSYSERPALPQLFVTEIRGLVQSDGTQPVRMVGWFRVVEISL